MSSPNSPYKEFGLSPRPPKPAKKKVGPFCPRPGEAVSFGHYFMPIYQFSTLGVRADPMTAKCRYCKKPKFAVESKKCKGAR